MQPPHDLLSNQEVVDSKGKKRVQSKQPGKLLAANLVIDQVANDLASQLKIEMEEMKDWLALNHPLPKEDLIQLLKLAKRYRLNPILGHLGYELDKDGSWQLFITVDGWIAILHQQNNFAGIAFEEAQELIDGIPAWMQCSIYRTNKSIPITVKEYLCEVRSDHPAWQTIPRRMLRHKTLQEAIRLAFGISQVICHELQTINTLDHQTKTLPTKQLQINRKSFLKEKLIQTL